LSPDHHTRVAENLDTVRRRMRAAAQRAGRDASDVCLVAVTKSARLEWMRQLVEAGVCDFGESRPQRLVDRVPQFSPSLRWHLIGHLQRNKVRPVLPLVELVQSIDSIRLLERVNAVAVELELCPRVLLEVNVSGERTKDGFSPQDLLRDWEQMLLMRPATVAGLMTMAPAAEPPEQARPHFAALRELRDRLRTQSPPEVTLPVLSMGMSGDFEVAIEEGATLIRIGSALFEGLISP
jgi:pyridoxal phosphate enzyme (YggS family)